jgi:MFS family permease
MLLAQAALMAVQPTLPLHIAGLARRDAVLVTGLLFSVAGVSTAIGATFIGKLKGLSYERSLRTGLLYAAIFSVLQGFTGSLWLLGLERFLFGFANAAVLVSGNVLIARRAPDETRGQVFGVLNGVSSLGSVVGPILGGYAAHAFNVPSSFFLSGMLFLIGVPLVWRRSMAR